MQRMKKECEKRKSVILNDTGWLQFCSTVVVSVSDSLPWGWGGKIKRTDKKYFESSVSCFSLGFFVSAVMICFFFTSSPLFFPSSCRWYRAPEILLGSTRYTKVMHPYFLHFFVEYNNELVLTRKNNEGNGNARSESQLQFLYSEGEWSKNNDFIAFHLLCFSFFFSLWCLSSFFFVHSSFVFLLSSMRYCLEWQTSLSSLSFPFFFVRFPTLSSPSLIFVHPFFLQGVDMWSIVDFSYSSPILSSIAVLLFLPFLVVPSGESRMMSFLVSSCCCFPVFLPFSLVIIIPCSFLLFRVLTCGRLNVSLASCWMANPSSLSFPFFFLVSCPSRLHLSFFFALLFFSLFLFVVIIFLFRVWTCGRLAASWASCWTASPSSPATQPWTNSTRSLKSVDNHRMQRKRKNDDGGGRERWCMMMRVMK